MKNLFNDISNDERQRILEMHQNATKRNYLFEQGTPAPDSAPAPGSVIPIPKEMTAKFKGIFNWGNMLRLFRTKSCGYTPGDNYFWQVKKGEDRSYLYLLTLQPSGPIIPIYRLTLVEPNDRWEFDGVPINTLNQGNMVNPSLILSQLFVYNPEATQYTGIAVEPEVYSQFLINYLTKNPNSQIAKALTVTPRTVGYDVTAEDVKKINNSPLYRQLARPATPATPAAPQG